MVAMDDAESELLKQWVIKRIEDISDAEPDVLADYVLALVKTDETEAVVRANCLENLKDFLQDNADTFVNDVFTAINTKAYDPTKAQSKPSLPSGPVFNAVAGGRGGFQQNHYVQDRQSNQSRKRSFHEWDGAEAQSQLARGSSERPMKQMRRGANNNRFDRGGRQSQSPMFQQPPAQMPGAPLPGLPNMPTPPPGMPPLDPNNPLSMLLAMQSMGIPLPGMPPMPNASSPPAQRRTGQRCRDYDMKGFCALGVSCPYDHGNDHFVVPSTPGAGDEYDPMNASLMSIQPDRTGTFNTESPRGRGGPRGRGRGGMSRGGGKRAEFSHVGQNHDRSISAVVVEQIPEEHFSQEAVREYFGQFGNIEEVTMQPYKRLAIVKYDDYSAARAAYDNPKVIFDNRFVKVYWYKPDKLPQPPDGFGQQKNVKAEDGEDAMMHQAETEEEKIDPAEVARKQEEAQKRQDENKRKAEEAEKARQDLNTKLKAMEDERKKMIEKLASKSKGKVGSPVVSSPAPNGDANGTADSKQTQALKEQLARLEREAESLGIDPNAVENGQAYGSYPPRGGYRGRGGFRGRGRGFDPSFRGGGWAPRGGRGGAVMRLDNRPKTICVTFPDGEIFEGKNQEGLNQFLLFSDNLESVEVSPHPTRKDAALVAFKERYLAENFMATANEIPHVGKVDLAWHATPLPPVAASSPASVPAATNGKMDLDIKMESSDGARGDEDAYDVADDDERWG